MESKTYCCYILKCSDGSYYCGYTDNIQRRVDLHNKGKGSKYVRSRLPSTLVYMEQFDNKRDAMKRECEIKKFTRRDKELLLISKVKQKLDGP